MATKKQKEAAVKRMQDAAKVMKSKTATKSEKASAKRKRTAANKIRTSKTTTKKASVSKTKLDKGGNIKDASTDTAARRSPTTYKPDVPIAAKGSKKVFTGTNIPTKGYSKADIKKYNARLKADLADKNYRGANDVIFDIAFKKGGGEGNPRVGAVQSGMYKLNTGPLWAEGQVNSTNDRYVIRNSKGEPTGEEVRFSDQHGVVKGKANEWKSVGSWGGNARAGILEGQPTTTPPPAGILASIVDLDDPNRTVLAGPGAGKPYTGDARVGTGDDTDTGRVRTRQTGGRGEYLATKYDRPGLLDWSHLAPPEMPGTLGTAQAQQSLLDRDLALYQPWRRPGVGEAFKYQPATAPTYATRASLLGGASPLVTNNNASILDNNTGNNNTTTDNGYTGPLGNQWDNYHDWYMNSPYTSPNAANHQAALRRLYIADNPTVPGLLEDSTGVNRSHPVFWSTASVPYESYMMDDFGQRGEIGTAFDEGHTPTFTDWFYGEGGQGASAGPIFGGVLGNKS